MSILIYNEKMQTRKKERKDAHGNKRTMNTTTHISDYIGFTEDK